MSSVARKASIIAVIIVLLVVAYFVSNSRIHRKFVNTAGSILVLSDTNAGNPKVPEHAHIWSVNSAGLGAVRLTHGAETDEDPSYSPDGSEIAFVSDRKGSPQVWIMNGDGTDAKPVTIGNDAKSMPRFSPDGKQIAYISRGALTVMNLDTQTQEVLLPIPHQGGTDTDPSAPQRQPVINFAWAPVAGENGATTIAAVQDSDTGTQQLTLVGGALADPVPVASAANVSFTWAPDGSHLLVALLEVAAVRPPAEVLNKLPQGVSLFPADHLFPKGYPKCAIYTFGSDGSLLPAVPPLAAMPGPAGPQNPAISPDGALAAFETWPAPNAEMDHYLGIQSVLTTSGARGPLRLGGPTAQPAFSADGTYFAFSAPVRKHPGMRDLFTINFNTKSVVNLTTGHLNVMEFCISPAKPKS